MTAEIQLQLNPYNSNPRFYKLAATGITSLSHQTTVNVVLPSIFEPSDYSNQLTTYPRFYQNWGIVLYRITAELAASLLRLLLR